MPDLLFEIGCEELPPAAVSSLAEQLETNASKVFADSRVPASRVIAYGTPRRVVLLAFGLPAKQVRKTTTETGPSASAAYDADGNLTKAGEGFRKKWGLKTGDLKTVETEKGLYLAAEVEAERRKTADVLTGLLPRLIESLDYPRTMRWLAGPTVFPRPIRWLVALLGGRVVGFEYAKLKAGKKSFGHRVTGYGPHDLPALFDGGKLHLADVKRFYKKEMSVVLDPADRRKMILSGATRLKLDGKPQVVDDYRTEYALDAVVNSVEYPRVVAGVFYERYLELPAVVLEAAMLGYLKLFPVHGATDRPIAEFVGVHNGAPKAARNVRAGLERVLAARLADASFFWDIDRKTPLDEMAGRLDSVLFAEGLGTLGDKAERLAALAGELGEWCDFDAEERADLVRAAEICKADLASEMVREKEFAHLQGVMGGLYAGAADEPTEVAAVVREHYRPVGAEDSLPDTKLGRALSILNRADTLAGCFGADMAPTASKDPFGLRRGAIGLCRLLLEDDEGWFAAVELERLLWRAVEGYGFDAKPDEEPWLDDLVRYVLARLRRIFSDAGYPADVINAVLEVRPLRPRDLAGRLDALAELRAKDRADYIDFVIAFKRPINILRQGRERNLEWTDFDPELIEQPEERALYETYATGRDSVVELIADGEHRDALDEIAAMRPAVDAFFDEVLVMCDDAVLRSNRLALMQDMADLFLSFADFTKLRGEEEYE
ncbi:MAG: glycine--tRNA ligase subunit beta [Candidatus Coatesbacteria bacterium]|nr:MAG: glycine--tRNA ligase subunit beta [Candidatus Coatesbacteria bacterium]